MRRREFIAILGGALAATSIFRPFTVHAQQKVWRIGLLLVGGPEFMGPYRTALRDLGYIEGKNIRSRPARREVKLVAFPSWPRN